MHANDAGRECEFFLNLPFPHILENAFGMLFREAGCRRRTGNPRQCLFPLCILNMYRVSRSLLAEEPPFG